MLPEATTRVHDRASWAIVQDLWAGEREILAGFKGKCLKTLDDRCTC